MTGKIVSTPLPKLQGNDLTLPALSQSQSGIEEWTSRVNDPNSIIALDLFCGAGGMSLGFQDAGFFIAAGIDHEESAIKTHSANFLSRSIVSNITEIENPEQLLQELGIPRVDIIIGGPPCQGFSRVGRAKLRSIDLEKHYHEVINSLYKEFVRFVEDLNPYCFVMENVPDMETFQDGELVDRIVDEFRKLGYRVSHQVLDAVDYGVPQRRKRLFIVGTKLGGGIVWPAPRLTEEEIVTVRDAIGDLPKMLPPNSEEEVFYAGRPTSEYQQLMRSRMPEGKENVVYDHLIRAVREDDAIIFALMDEGQKYRDVPEHLRRYRSDIFQDKYWKMIWNEPSWTVTAHIRKDAYRYIHPDRQQGRMLSIREFARIQSFPDHFRFCGAPTRRMQQIGNAVPPILAQRIAQEMMEQFQDYRSKSVMNNGYHQT
jgi:DNA (cytosine-5)-methyltransferase 1